MDSKGFRRAGHGDGIANAVHKAEQYASQRAAGHTRAKAKQAILSEINSQLQVRADKMRLLARAEEGLAQADSNPYSPDDLNRQILSNPPSQENAVQSEYGPSKLPVSTARQRRRQQQGQTGLPHRRVNIQEYRPGYTWNRGGRVKELRIRCTARKFLYLWIRRVFGRMTPSNASHHYNRHLLRQAFCEWHEMWWETRREWRLMVRAECHHRYVMWAKLFNKWKQFVLCRRKKHAKESLAENHCTKVVTKKCLQSWCVHVQHRREKAVQKKLADNWHVQSVVRQTWGRWIEHLSIVNHRHQMEVVALQFWAYRIQAQHWLWWYEALRLRQESRQKRNRAVLCHNASVLRKAFRAWCQYSAGRKEKQRLKDYAHTIHVNSVKQYVFTRWYDQWSLRRSIAQHEHQIRIRACKFLMLRTFVSWKHYIHLRHDQQELYEMAQHHYSQHLLTLGFSSFRLNAVQKRLKSMRLVIGQQLHQKQLLRWGWNSWMAQCDRNEEIKLIPQTRKAQAYYRQILLGKAMHSLMEYTRWRQHRQAQYTRADAYYYVRAMPQFLFRMRVFVQLMKNNRENSSRAMDFRRENLLAKFYFLWINNLERSKEDRMNERMAILHHEGTTVKSFFVQWKVRTAVEIEMARKEEEAVEHYCVQLTLCHLRAWKTYVDDLKQSQQNDLKATRHKYKQHLSRAFSKWKQYSHWRLQRGQRKKQADQFYQRKAFRKVLRVWRQHTDDVRNRKRQAEEKYNLKCQELLRHTLSVWRENVEGQVRDRAVEQTAKLHHHQQVLVKVLKTWHRFAAIHAYKKSETRQWVESAREELRKKSLQRFMSRWQQARDEQLLLKLHYEQAAEHHRNLVQRNVMGEWKQFTQLSIRKNLLMKQCMWFHNVRLSAKFFVRWRQAHSEAEDYNRKTNIALWHWSLVLQKKVLIWWFEYIQERRRKKQRVAEAMERRRTRLIRDGVSQWLKVSGDLSEMRGKFAAQQQAKSAYVRYQLVQKCALYWKHWAARRKEQRGGSDMSVRRMKSSPRSQPVTTREGRASPQQHAVMAQNQVPALNTDSDLPPVISARSPMRSREFIRGRSADEQSIFPVQQARPKPRRPAFLVESLKRAGLYGSSSDKELASGALQQPEKDLDTGLSLVHDDESRSVLSELKTPRDILLTDSTAVTSHHQSTAKVSFEFLPGDLDSQSRKVEKLVLTSSAEDIDSLPQSCPPPPEYHRSSTPPCGDIIGKNLSESPVTIYRHDTGTLVKSQQSSSSGQKISGLEQTQGHGSDSKPALLTPADFLCKKTGHLYNPSTELKQKKDTGGLSALPYLSEIGAGDTSRGGTQGGWRLPAYSLDAVGGRTQSVQNPTWNDRSEFTGHVAYVKQRNGLPAEKAPVDSRVIHSDIVNIRNRLKKIDENKKRLRTLQKQKQQLAGWLRDAGVEDRIQEDIDLSAVKQEVFELDTEIKHLKKDVELQKPECTKLIQEVQELMQNLGHVT